MDMSYPDHATDVDVSRLYAEQSRPPRPDRPWVLTNMIASIDGATAVDDLSGALGGPADRQVFRAIRAVADIILVGAATARAEDYGPPIVSDAIQQRRKAAGRAPRPRFALVSRSLDLDPTARIFEVPADERPIIATVTSAPTDRRTALEAVAEVVNLDDRLDTETGQRAGVDLLALLGLLRREHGAEVVLSEGGPTLNGQLVELDAIDEVCLSLSPNLVGGPSKRIAQSGDPVDAPTTMTPSWILTEDDLLFLRYVTLRR